MKIKILTIFLLPVLLLGCEKYNQLFPQKGEEITLVCEGKESRLNPNFKYTYQEKEKSTDYRDGIIDCIVALRRFQRFKGFGDYEWKPYFNSAVDISTDTREY